MLGGEVVSYAEVDHWMWRLFLDDYGSVCNHLALSSNTPLLSEASLPPPITLLYGISSVLTPRQPYWPKRCASLMSSLNSYFSMYTHSPCAVCVFVVIGTPLLYSRTLLQRDCLLWLSSLLSPLSTLALDQWRVSCWM